jgi:uncharacterized protein with von Willebrand factor type A (vWA) domain
MNAAPRSMDQALTARVAGFVATLRANGFALGHAEQFDALRTAERLGLVEREPLKLAWRSLLAGRHGEWVRFDDLFDSYWQPPNASRLVETRSNVRGAPQVDAAGTAPAPRADGGPARALEAASGEGEAAAIPAADAHHEGASAAHGIEQTDFADVLSSDQKRAMDEALAAFAKQLRHLRLRRERAATRGRRVDLRRTLRSSVAHGGVPIELMRKAPRVVRPRLVLLVDVSRSMSVYSFFFLRFAWSLRAVLRDVRAFCYHTRLVDIGLALADTDPWRAQERLQMLSEGWAGGTRIGECLGEFNRHHASRALHSRSIVVIVSDGYDTGEPAQLAREMARLKSRARRIVWLNPLLGRDGYRPVARGMQAALPHVDLFAGARDLASLKAVLPELAKV